MLSSSLQVNMAAGRVAPEADDPIAYADGYGRLVALEGKYGSPNVFRVNQDSRLPTNNHVDWKQVQR